MTLDNVVFKGLKSLDDLQSRGISFLQVKYADLYVFGKGDQRYLAEEIKDSRILDQYGNKKMFNIIIAYEVNHHG